MANAGCSNVKFSKSNFLYNVTPKISAISVQKKFGAFIIVSK